MSKMEIITFLKNDRAVRFSIGLISVFIIVWFFLHFLAPAILLDGPTAIGYLFMKEDAIFSKNFSDHNFIKVRKGMSKAEVDQIMNKPLSKSIQYMLDNKFWHGYVYEIGNGQIRIEKGGKIKLESSDVQILTMSIDDFIQAHGEPTYESWIYVHPNGSRSGRFRDLKFENGVVTKINSEFHID